MNKLAKENQTKRQTILPEIVISWLITGFHLGCRSLSLMPSTVCTSIPVPTDDSGENGQLQPQSRLS